MTTKTILKWIVGVLFLFSGIDGIIKNEFLSLLLILLGLFIIPLSYKILIEEKANLKLSSKIKWFVVIVVSLLFAGTSIANSYLKGEFKGSKDTELVSNKDREDKIETTKYYLSNEYKNVTDENGISYKLSVSKKEVSREKVFESDKIIYQINLNPIFIRSYKVVYDFSLFSNGELKDVIRFNGYLIESQEANDRQLGFCSYFLMYFPELDSENKKEIISSFTGGNCGLGEDVNNLVAQNKIKAIKAIGILDDK